MVTIYAAKTKNILLGRVGENDHTQVVFDVSEWLTEYPNSVIGLYNSPSRQNDAYPVANIQQTGSTVTWTVKSSDYAAKTTNSNLAPSSASAAWQELTQISAAVSSGIAGSAVRYDTAQSLTGSQQDLARSNIGAVSYAQVSTLSSSVTSLGNRVNTAEGNVSALNTRVGVAEGDITALQTALNNKITVSGTTLVIS